MQAQETTTTKKSLKKPAQTSKAGAKPTVVRKEGAAPKKKLVTGVVDFNDGSEHPLEAALKDGLEFTAIACAKVNDFSNQWVSFTLEMKGTEIVSIKAGYPNMKAISLDEAKVSFVENFLDAE
jgi:hypothetical protein